MAMPAALRRIALIAFALGWALPARADPLLFFLMSAAKEIAAQVAARPPAGPVQSVPEPLATYPGTTVDPKTLRGIIDQSFGYLSDTQRGEVFESLNNMLLDPKLNANRAALLEYFLHKALAVREAQVQLASLSDDQKLRLAARFSRESASLPDAERKRLHGLLEQHLLPVPPDLNQMLLAGLQEPR